MDMQGQRFFSTREFRIAVIAIAAVAALAVGAYLFGSGLQADTSASVAPSPLGSSLTAVRESPSLDYVGRLISASEASRAAALAALANSGADFHADQSNAAAAASRADSSGRLISAAAAARLTALAALAKSRSDFHADQSNAAAAASAATANRFQDRYDRMNSSPAAVSSALQEMIARSGSADYAARAAGLWFDIPAAGAMASQPAGSQSRAALLDMIERSGSADYAVRAAGLWFDIPAAGTMAVQPAGSQSRSIESSAADQYQNSWMGFTAPDSVEIKPSAADQYQNSWMGFTAPDSVEIKPSATSGAASLAGLAERWAPFYAGLDKAMTAAGARSAQGSSSSIVESSTDQQFQWIKPEGIKPSEAAGSAAEQNAWIKPEGISPK